MLRTFVHAILNSIAGDAAKPTMGCDAYGTAACPTAALEINGVHPTDEANCLTLAHWRQCDSAQDLQGSESQIRDLRFGALLLHDLHFGDRYSDLHCHSDLRFSFGHEPRLGLQAQLHSAALRKLELRLAQRRTALYLAALYLATKYLVAGTAIGVNRIRVWMGVDHQRLRSGRYRFHSAVPLVT